MESMEAVQHDTDNTDRANQPWNGNKEEIQLRKQKAEMKKIQPYILESRQQTAGTDRLHSSLDQDGLN